MNNLSPYTIALLLNEGKFSSVKASKTIGFISHDALTRQLCKNWEYAVVSDWSTLPPGGDIVLDDTTIAKRYAKRIANVHWVYDSSEERSLPGYKLLLMLWVTPQSTSILRVVLPGTENLNELVRQSLKEFSQAGLEPNSVLFDNWYAANQTLNLIHSLGWTYTCRMKSNRLLNGLPMKKQKFLGAKSKTGRLKGVAHRVQTVKHGGRYLATNELIPHTSASLAKAYQRRWVIETVFRDLKQVLHLQKCSARSLEAQFNHTLACFEGYLFLRRTFPHLSPEAAQQEILSQWHNQSLSLEGFLAMAA
jgi:transposase